MSTVKQIVLKGSVRAQNASDVLKLTESKVYEVMCESTTHYTFLNDDGWLVVCDKRCFDEVNSLADFGLFQVSKNQSIECPCGIARVNCTYHK